MNRYQAMMEQMPVPEGQAERLKERVLAFTPPARRPYRPRNLAQKVLLAALLLLLLTVSVGAAVEMVPWDRIFTERFGSAAADSPAARSVFQNVEVTSVCGDVTLTVRQALGDEKTLYLLVDYQLPADADMNAVQSAWEAGEGPVCTLDVFSGGEVCWDDIRGMDCEAVRTMLLDRELHYSGSVETVAFDRDSRTLTMLLSCNFLKKVSLHKPLTLLADLPEAVLDGEMVPMADHPAVVTFQPGYTARTRDGKQRSDGVTYRAELTPLALTVEARGYDSQKIRTGIQMGLDTVLIYRDGTEVPLATKNMGYGSGTGMGLTGVIYRADFTVDFPEPVDASAVRAVRVGEVEIYLR